MITDLGVGEAEVLALALEEPGSLVIMDDRLAREVAGLQKIRITGTAGVLLKAKWGGHLLAVAPLLERLCELGFWLSEKMRRQILRMAQEE